MTDRVCVTWHHPQRPPMIDLDILDCSIEGTYEQPVLQAQLRTRTLTAPVRQRLRAFHKTRTDLRVYRGDELIFAGPLTRYVIHNDLLTLTSDPADLR